jgi:hypothetical protein
VRIEACPPGSADVLHTCLHVHAAIGAVRRCVAGRGRGKLTCDSAGAHLEERLVWRRHCRAGEAKVRAANMLNMQRESYNSTGATDGVVAAGVGGAGRKVGVAQSSVAEKASSAAGINRQARTLLFNITCAVCTYVRICSYLISG